MEDFTFDIIIKDSLVKYSRFAFGTALTNIEYLFDVNSLSKTKKNLDEFFKIQGPIVDYEGNTFKFKNVVSIFTNNKTLFHLFFEQITTFAM